MLVCSEQVVEERTGIGQYHLVCLKLPAILTSQGRIRELFVTLQTHESCVQILLKVIPLEEELFRHHLYGNHLAQYPTRKSKSKKVQGSFILQATLGVVVSLSLSLLGIYGDQHLSCFVSSSSLVGPHTANNGQGI